jgi:hypothetical protein
VIPKFNAGCRSSTISTRQIAVELGPKSLESWLVFALGTEQRVLHESMEGLMAFVTGDVVPVTGEELPFKVVFMQGTTVLSEWLVESVEDGQSQIVDVLKSLVDDEEEDEEDAA